ncbi:4-carboxymuconolactone decarboxylase [Aureimonas endophytica]|uniref:4-carboxymuconolactone decarboxylase n=1 Tax=Aureimonas endophytica TaxID=2027858 RepID=A0A916ZLP0_9HYPH|nr:carboxymuconolactone decarboxylase family protein [Aureimonas endophytica]GGE02884.1 4-carboxymuconolactone decarboxylase [Aureimonas endophytica]
MHILVTATLAMVSITGAAMAQDQRKAVPRVAPDVVRETVPPLADYTDEVLFADVWARPGLSPRDRSLITVAALMAGSHTAQMRGHLGRALDNGVTPVELGETITHLAFYAGWPNAMSSVTVAREVFAARGIAADALLTNATAPLAIDQAQEQARAASVDANVRPTTPALADYTDRVLFADLWLRPQLAPRDRSLVTVAALIAGGKSGQLPFHLGRAMDAGLTRDQVSEVVTHLAFYTGWPNAMSAVPVVKSVFDDRPA